MTPTEKLIEAPVYDWYPFKDIAEALDNRKWSWALHASDLKYMNIRIDTRDNHAIVTVENRDGKVIARSKSEFLQLMMRLDRLAEGGGE